MYRIWVSKEDRNRLVEHFNVSEPTISGSLCFKRNRLQNREIRRFAMNELNGQLIVYDNGKAG